MGLLYRFWFINRILQLIVLSIERDMLLGPHPPNDIQFLPEYGNTFRRFFRIRLTPGQMLLGFITGAHGQL